MSGQRVALVTGGTRGIGRAIAEALTNLGMRVIVLAHRDIGTGSRDFQAVDLATETGVNEAVRFVTAATARLDVIVNNAGSIGEHESLQAASYEDIDRSYRLHTMAPLLLTRGLLPLLRQGQYPSVINVGSIYGAIPDADIVPYALSKCAVPLLTEIMARSYGPELRANVILPGHIDTDMTRGAPAEFLEQIVARTPMRRIGNTSEIAALVEFLVSERAAFLSGSQFRVDGGYWAAR